MKKILKQVITIAEEVQFLHLPVDAVVIHVGSQNDGFISIWFETSLTQRDETKIVQCLVVSTGQEIRDEYEYVATILQSSGSLVSHLYWVPNLLPLEVVENVGEEIGIGA